MRRSPLLFLVTALCITACNQAAPAVDETTDSGADASVTWSARAAQSSSAWSMPDFMFEHSSSSEEIFDPFMGMPPPQIASSAASSVVVTPLSVLPPSSSAAFSAPIVAASTLQISTTAFTNGSTIPADYTCAGSRNFVPLQFSGIPAGTQSLAVTVEDIDNGSGPWTHWTAWNIPPQTTSLTSPLLPTGSVEGASSGGAPGYHPPCDPGAEHRYVYRVFALDANLTLAASADPAALRTAMQGHVLAEAQLMGRHGP